MAVSPNSSDGPWFAEPPEVGGKDQYTLIHAAVGTPQNQLFTSDGYPGFTSEADAEAYVKQQDGTFALSLNPVTAAEQLVDGQTTQKGTTDQTGISNPLGYLKNIAGFFKSLGERNTWIRVAKVLIGGVLVIAGFIKLTGAKQTAQSIVSKVPIVPV